MKDRGKVGSKGGSGRLKAIQGSHNLESLVLKFQSKFVPRNNIAFLGGWSIELSIPNISHLDDEVIQKIRFESQIFTSA
jgi:hypothetical protein